MAGISATTFKQEDAMHGFAVKAAVVLSYLPLQCAMIAAAVVAADDPLGVAAAPAGIFNESTLRAWAVIGSVLGSMLAVALAPPAVNVTTTEVTRRLLFKGVASISGGIIFTPLAFRYSAIDVNVDTVLSISGLMAFLTTSVLHKLVPVIERALASRINNGK